MKTIASIFTIALIAVVATEEHANANPIVLWSQVVSDGFGDPNNVAALPLAVFEDHLYVGTHNDATGCEIWRSPDYETWSQVSMDGFGDPHNIEIAWMTVFGSHLYAGTVNEFFGGQIWRSSDGTSWDPVSFDGFGDPGNVETLPISVFGGHLYAGTVNHLAGGQIWRSSDGTSWDPVSFDGFGDPGNVETLPISVFGGHLYAGTVNHLTGGQIWRSSDGTSWDPVNVDGFGDPHNVESVWMTDFDGYLYVGTVNYVTGGEIWRSSNGTTWTQVNVDGFGNSDNVESLPLSVFRDTLWAGTANAVTGGEVWLTPNGTDWLWDQLDFFGGFGDPNNHTALPLLNFQDHLFAGTKNDVDGGQIWGRYLYEWPEEPVFVRGDANADGQHDLFDALLIFYWLGGSADPPPCERAADAEDDGDVDLFDGLRVIYWLGGMAPAPPQPCCNIPGDCGWGAPILSCFSYPPCGWGGQPVAKVISIGRREESRLVVEGAVNGKGPVVVPVILINAEPLVGFSFTMEYDPELLTAISVDNAGLVTNGFDVFVGGVENPGLVKVLAVGDMGIDDGVKRLPAGQHRVAQVIFEVSDPLDREVALHLTEGVMAISYDRALNHRLVDGTIKASAEVSETFGLSQNYPNPFNPVTEISYVLPVACHVVLEIYDVLGREVVTLVNEQQDAGYKTVQWDSRRVDGGEVSSGVYLCRIRAGEFTAARTMILIR